MKKKNAKIIFTAAVLLVLLAGSIAMDAALPSYHIAITVVKRPLCTHWWQSP